MDSFTLTNQCMQDPWSTNEDGPRNRPETNISTTLHVPRCFLLLDLDATETQPAAAGMTPITVKPSGAGR